MKKSGKGIPALKRPTLSKNHKIRRMKYKTNYMKLISGGIIEDFNLHRNKLEWVNPRSRNKSNKPFSVFKDC